MDDNTTYKVGIGLLLLIGIIAVGLSINHTKENITKAEVSYLELLHKQDSLQSVINDLQTELEMQEKGFSDKEQRYEDILFEYEYGVERLKETHPSAYKEFHRIIAFKERYSIEDRNDNKKRLSYKQF
jgi:predicted  nucleic acid-binding Zn-ribbon protein